MIKAILFDLDDTLLGNEVDRFMPEYFALLGQYAQPVLADQRAFLGHLVQSTQETIRNTDPALTNADVFWDTFQSLTGRTRAELEPFFAGFYEQEFPRLRATCQPRPESAGLVAAALERGLKVVIATNPLFPRTAIEQRLDWAGVPVDRFDYALVTTYENMHATKPQLDYYREILDMIGVQPGEALMVGDDWKNDIAPAAALGIRTYWLAAEDAPAPDPTLINRRGSLADLEALLTGDWLEELGR